jgi:hypothetical protein
MNGVIPASRHNRRTCYRFYWPRSQAVGGLSSMK